MPPKPSPFPQPLVYPPLAQPHLQTFILLHGRGSSLIKFAPSLLSTTFPSARPSPFSPPQPPPPILPSPTPESRTTPSQLSQPSPDPPPQPANLTTLRHLFPHAKFLFPCAPHSRATIYKRSLITQWFDSPHVDSPNPSTWHLQSGLMITGLQQTVAYLHELIRAEARELDAGERGVVLGGLSQGCAASLVAGLLWDGERLRGLVGMCGWLPFMREMERVVVDEEEGGEDVFERNENGQEEKRVSEVGAVAMSVLREMLDLEAEGRSSRPAVLSTPVFLGHGSVDEKVSIQLGKASAETLMSLGVDVEWHTYEGLGHWFSDEMIADMAHFLDEKASMEK